MRRLLLIGVALFAGAANGEGDDICVRNYLGGDPAIDICERIGGRYVHIQSRQGMTEGLLCTLAYPDHSCTDGAKEYRFVRTKDGSKVCVVDFNQPHSGNYCELSPDYYSYAQPAD